jgi:sugar/nucleoside kinase (ribokinase family)
VKRESSRAHPRPIPSGDLDLLAVGEAVVDLISVEETDSLRDARTFRLHVGGSPANVARTVARLGGRAALVARVGDDPFGHLLRAELEGTGVLCDHLVLDPDARTTVIFVSHTRGTPDFLAYRDADFRLAPEQVTEEAIGRARVVHVSAFALSRSPARWAAERALHLGHERECILSVDPNYSPRLWTDRKDALETLERALSMATLTKPSLDDARRLFGSVSPKTASGNSTNWARLSSCSPWARRGSWSPREATSSTFRRSPSPSPTPPAQGTRSGAVFSSPCWTASPFPTAPASPSTSRRGNWPPSDR